MRPRAIVDHLETVIGLSGRPVRLVSIIESELSAAFGLEKIAAAERAEALSSRVVSEVEERCIAAEHDGLTPVLTIIGSHRTVIAGYCHVLGGDSEAIANLKRQRAYNQQLLAKMQSLTFAQFETFGKRVLHELGAGITKVTTHGNDQGIDFFGEFSLGQLTEVPSKFLRLAHDVKLLFAGQAKHYPTRAVGTDVVRELVGAVSLARTKTFSADGLDLFKDLEIRPFSPVIALLFTTGRLSSGAVKLAASAGVVARSGEQLAAFLADRGVGIERTAAGLAFEAAAFDRWLVE